MSKTISVMTYNVHSGIGMDGRVSPLRIAEVIDQCNPDIVALQELDAGLDRTEMIDQAHLIALTLNMSYHFHSSLQVETGEYGNAILSRYPLKLTKGGAIPTQPFATREPRGVLWAETDVEGRKLQVVATHLGLNRQERRTQAEAITGPEWLRHPDCRPPVILCGDLNSMPGSPPYRRIAQQLEDAQCCLKGHRPLGTWPVRLPFMRIDHIFISSDLKVLAVSVPKNKLTRISSDHLPLVVRLELP